MRVVFLLTLFLALSYSATTKHAAQTPKLTYATVQTKPKGQWYMAASGHAVYCFGPVIKVTDWQSEIGFRRVATFCRGEKPMVDLKE